MPRITLSYKCGTVASLSRIVASSKNLSRKQIPNDSFPKGSGVKSAVNELDSGDVVLALANVRICSLLYSRRGSEASRSPDQTARTVGARIVSDAGPLGGPYLFNGSEKQCASTLSSSDFLALVATSMPSFRTCEIWSA
jgi:hypothetical protein